jgi:hypothetical protein
METRTQVQSMVKSVSRIAVIAVCLGALGACASIPKRAWANGEAMTSSRAYNEVMQGNTSFAVRRQLQSTLNPRLLNYNEVAYPAFPKFGTWW